MILDHEVKATTVSAGRALRSDRTPDYGGYDYFIQRA